MNGSRGEKRVERQTFWNMLSHTLGGKIERKTGFTLN